MKVLSLIEDCGEPQKLNARQVDVDSASSCDECHDCHTESDHACDNG